MIKFCDNGANYNSTGCNLAHFTCWVRNVAVFGSMRRFIFPMTLSGIMLTNGTYPMGSIGVTTENYYTNQRIWYNQLNMPGWSNSSYPFASIGSGETYSEPFTGLNTVGVAAAARSLSEPCSSCLATALISAQPSAKQMTTSVSVVASEFLNAVNLTEAALNLQQLFLTAVNNTERGQTFMDTYVGFTNNDFYLVSDCRRWTSVCPPGATFVGYIASPTIYGSSIRRKYVLNNQGVLNQSTEVLDPTTPFIPTQRAWFLTSYGWTDEFTLAASGLSGRSYAYPLPGGSGVAAVSYFLAQAPQCTFSNMTNQCHNESYAVTASTVAAEIGTEFSTPITTIDGVANVCNTILERTIQVNKVIFLLR